MSGIARAEAEGRTLLLDLRAGAGPASNVLLAPRQARRELIVGGRTVTETVVLPERTGGLVVQWSAAPGPDAPLEVRFRLPGAHSSADRLLEKGEMLHESGPGGSRSGPLAFVGADGALRLVRLDPPPASWDVTGDETTTSVIARVELPPGGVATLVAALGATHDAAAAALEAASRARVHETRAERALAASRSERVALHTGVAELDDALEWAKARLEGVQTRGGGPPLDRAFLALGLAAAGMADRSAAVAAGLPLTEPAGLLARAWLAGWTGRLPPHADVDVIRAAARDAVDTPAGAAAAERILRRASAAAAADLLDALGDRPGAGELRAALPDAPVALGTGRSLPVVGAAPSRADEDGAAALGALLGVPILPSLSADPPEPDEPTGAALRAWGLFAAGHPDPAYLGLRRHLGRAFEGPVGCWPGGTGGDPVEDSVGAALVPVLVLHGLLGARPDAAFGRLRLAPALPTSWTRCRITGIRLGDAVLDLDCRLGSGRRTFVLRPTAGPVPPTLVFEPLVPGPVESVEIDGAPAEVEIQTEGDRTRVRLQIPVDRERSVGLVGTDG